MDGLNRGGVTEMPSSSCDRESAFLGIPRTRVSSRTPHFSSLHYDFVLARGAQHVASMNLASRAPACVLDRAGRNACIHRAQY